MGLSTPMLLNADSLPEILTARELEGFIRLDVKTIYAYVKSGQIPYMRMGSNLRFCKREILAWMEERHYRP
jgi:excisionase family DNA binding protein